jgi:hypothetical protein
VEGTAVTKEEAWSLANHWVAAWNAHDLDLIMTHYEDAIELISPVAARLLGTPDGKVAGKPNLRAYFHRGLEAYPELHFHLEDVLLGHKQHRALLHKSKGNTHGRIHGTVFERESGASRGELQFLTGDNNCWEVQNPHPNFAKGHEIRMGQPRGSCSHEIGATRHKARYFLP